MDELRPLLARHGFRFSKSMGQNFLIDREIPERIVREAAIGSGDGVLEIGPGVGALTLPLCRSAGRVAALELDKRLIPVLKETAASCTNCEIVQGDLLKTDLRAFAERCFSGLRPVVCANLPYNITSPAIAALLDSKAFESITVMVQREVAERICAAPGTDGYGAFTVYVSYNARSRLLFDVPAGSFFPRPKVQSAVLTLEQRDAPPVSPADERVFFRVVRAIFAQRRKTLLNGLHAGFAESLGREDMEGIIRACALEPGVRGETLGLKEYCALADRIFAKLEQK